MRVMEELITEFMKENKDIKVVYESMKGTEYYEVLKKEDAFRQRRRCFHGKP
ncbi:MAG: hypothetical protein ACLSG9_00095 [Eubacterium sp.]